MEIQDRRHALAYLLLVPPAISTPTRHPPFPFYSSCFCSVLLLLLFVCFCFVLFFKILSCFVLFSIFFALLLLLLFLLLLLLYFFFLLFWSIFFFFFVSFFSSSLFSSSSSSSASFVLSFSTFRSQTLPPFSCGPSNDFIYLFLKKPFRVKHAQCAEPVQIPKYKTHAYKTTKTAHVSRQPCSNIHLSCEER